MFCCYRKFCLLDEKRLTVRWTLEEAAGSPMAFRELRKFRGRWSSKVESYLVAVLCYFQDGRYMSLSSLVFADAHVENHQLVLTPGEVC